MLSDRSKTLVTSVLFDYLSGYDPMDTPLTKWGMSPKHILSAVISIMIKTCDPRLMFLDRSYLRELAVID